MHSIVLPILLCTAVLGQSAAAADQAEVVQEQVKRWIEAYADIAAAYRLSVDDDGQYDLEFYSQPLLQYTNPIRETQQHGAAFVWTRDGRPTAVGTFWSAVSRNDPEIRRIAHEFVSLTDVPITAVRQDTVIWSTQAAGVTIKPVADAPAPADSAPRRLIQMRSLARQFTADILPNVEQARELRLLPQPLYRYPGTSEQTPDGGLFVFVMGTDPEVILQLEVRQTNDGPKWHYALARFSNVPLRVSHNETIIWTRGKAEPYVRDQPYFLYWGVEERPSRIE
jgi:hypothetical protein